MAFGELLRMLKFRSVSLKKMLIYPLKWMVEVFLKEIVVIYLTSPMVEKNEKLDRVGPTLKSLYHSRYFSIPSPEGNVYSTRKQSRILQTFWRFFPSSHFFSVLCCIFRFEIVLEKTL